MDDRERILRIHNTHEHTIVHSSKDTDRNADKKRRREARRREFEDLSVRKEKISPGVYLRTTKLAPMRAAILQKVSAMLTDAKVPLTIRMPTASIVKRFEELGTLCACTIDLKKALVKLILISGSCL